MVTDPVLAWVLTVVFSATGLYSIVRLFIDRAPLLSVAHVLHLVMSVGMVAMSWPWWIAIPAIPQTILFGAAAMWFVVLLALHVHLVAVGGHGPWHQAAHALMMIGMFWMTVSMHTGVSGEAQAHQHSTLPLWAALSGVALTAALLVAGVIFLVELAICLRGSTTWLGHTGDVAAGTVMSLGMAAMCWPMITG